MTTANEKLAQDIERFAALLRSGEWDSEGSSWSPEFMPKFIRYQRIDDPPQKPEMELVRQEFQFTLARRAKKVRV